MSGKLTFDQYMIGENSNTSIVKVGLNQVESSWLNIHNWSNIPLLLNIVQLIILQG